MFIFLRCFSKKCCVFTDNDAICIAQIPTNPEANEENRRLLSRIKNRKGSNIDNEISAFRLFPLVSWL